MEKKVHHNIPQIMFDLVMARLNVLIWGRATGKTEGPIADFSLSNWIAMPRSNGAFYCNTYTDVLTKVLPAVILGWERMGYFEKIHFFVGEYAPDKYKWKKAYRAPQDPRHYIHCVNGSGIFLVSGDRATSNGFSLDWAAIDEARLQKLNKLKEFILTIRGNAEHFGHLSNHGSILYVSDMPRSAKEKWLLEYRKMMDEEVIRLIIAVNVKLMQLEDDFEKAEEKQKKKIQYRINHYVKELHFLRKNSVYFSLASTLDNVHALGLDVIKNFRRQLSDIDFLISVLNKEISAILNCFYANLDDDLHGYTAENYSFIDNLELERSAVRGSTRDCRWDSDINPGLPLEISCDYNAAINWVATGQSGPSDEYNILSSLFVKQPEYLPQLAQKWCDYYSHHPTKEVIYYYDNTAVGNNAKGDIPYYQEWIRILSENKWNVKDVYIGQSPSHHSRYLVWQMSLNETNNRDTRLLRFRYNKRNNPHLFTSMSTTPVKRTGNEWKKDKSSERIDSGVPPEEATHLGEAIDILWYAKNRHRLEDSSAPWLDAVFSSAQ